MNPTPILVQQGDCRDVLAARTGPRFAACVTDPPYELGFMGRAWDRSGVAFQVETWRAVFDQMLPGAHLVAFGGTRTYHRMVVAIEDAGFEIRDQLAWAYGSGFPKSLDLAKAIDKAAGRPGSVEPNGPAVRRMIPGADQLRDGWEKTNGREYQPGAYRPATADAERWDGWGTALKPAWEPICLARKPLDQDTIVGNVLANGAGGINIDTCRTMTGGPVKTFDRKAGDRNRHQYRTGTVTGPGEMTDRGRFPANLLTDGSDEVFAAFPISAGQQGDLKSHSNTRQSPHGIFGGMRPAIDHPARGDSGSAARFFYSAKAGPLDRLGSEHPTVKPVDLMRWLVRLVTPPGGLLLDPFAGSGTTGIAALAEGRSAELIDLVPAHVADIETKLAHLRGEGARIVERHLKRRADRAAPGDLPLFGGAA